MFTFVTEWKVLSCHDVLEEPNPCSVTAVSVCQAPGVLRGSPELLPKGDVVGDAPAGVGDVSAGVGDVAWGAEQDGMRLSSPGGPR